MRSLRLLPLGILLSVLVSAAPAQASPRSEATRLIAMERSAGRALASEVTLRSQEVMARIETCLPEDAPPEIADEATMRTVSLTLRRTLEPFTGELRRFAERVRGFQTPSAVVRRTARAVGDTNRLMAELGSDAPDPCEYFDAWRAAGWTADFRLSPDVRSWSVEQVAALRRAGRVIARSLRTFRRYGVRRTWLRRFEVGYRDTEFLADLPAL